MTLHPLPCAFVASSTNHVTQSLEPTQEVEFWDGLPNYPPAPALVALKFQFCNGVELKGEGGGGDRARVKRNCDAIVTSSLEDGLAS